jgi:hypothetical protein
VKIAGIEFKEIDLTKVNDYTRVEELIPNPNNDPKIALLSRKIAFLSTMKTDIAFHEEMMNKKIWLDSPENKNGFAKFKTRTNRRIKKQEKDIVKICKELGWIK